MPAKRKESFVKLNSGIVLACSIGFALSYYAYIVETRKEKDESYTAMCDISEHVSCTKAFMSEYGKGFGIIPKDSVLYLPNCVYGLGFYTLLAVLGLLNNYLASVTLLSLGILSNIISIYLAFILYLLKDICVVCVGTYIVNAIVLILAVQKVQKLSKPKSRETREKKSK